MSSTCSTRTRAEVAFPLLSRFYGSCLWSHRIAAISVAELAKIFDTLQLKMTEAQVAAILKKVDKDADGQLNFSEFVHVMSHQPKSTQSEAYLLAAFKQYDKNGDGYITRQELRETMAKTGESLTEEELTSYVHLVFIRD